MPKTWLAANAGEADLCCNVGDAAGRNPNDWTTWQCCDVSSSEVLVNSTGTVAALNYCCPKGSIVYDFLNSKCSSTCPENASTTYVSGNQIGYSPCYCTEGFTWDAQTGKCVEANPCGEGQVSVTNYNSDGSENGTVCCEAKEDIHNESCSDNDGESNCTHEVYKGYSVIGAVNGTCCGSYTYDSTYATINGEMQGGQCGEVQAYSYDIKINGGVAYCAQNLKRWDCSTSLEDPSGVPYMEQIYLSESKYCFYQGGVVIYCSCSSSGNPVENGSSCDP